MLLYWILWTTLLVVLLIASWTDLCTMTIPNWLVLVGGLIGVVEHAIFQGVTTLSSHIFHGTTYLAYGLIWFVLGPLFSKVTRFQAGDAKLFAVVAVYTGMMGVPLILARAVVAQFVIYIVRFAMGRMEIHLPFAPAISIGSVGLLMGQLMWMKGGF